MLSDKEKAFMKSIMFNKNFIVINKYNKKTFKI